MDNFSDLKIQPLNVSDDQWKNLIQKPHKERYEQQSNELVINNVTGRILGTPYDETEYFITLYDLYTSPNIHVLSEILDKSIEQDMFQSIQKIHMINQEENGLSVNRFVAFLDGEELLPKYNNNLLQRHLRKSLMTVLTFFKDNHQQGLSHPDFRRVLVDVIKWTWNHVDGWFKQFNPEEDIPHIIWYGQASKSQQYFLYFLMELGCDVLIFHPESEDSFSEIDPQRNMTWVQTYPTTTSLQPFPTEKPERQGTVAYRATKEMDEVLHHEGSQLYKPWQFRNYTPQNLTLKTTYDEIFLIAKELAFVRPNFKATKGSVEIPNIFAKVMGVSKNTKEYWERIQTLTEYKNVEVVKDFPMTEEDKSNHIFHYRSTLDKEGNIDPLKLMENNLWRYGHLPESVQSAIANAISRMCSKPKLVANGSESEEDVQLYLFSQATNIPSNHLSLFQTFDYAQEVPKLIVYNTELTGFLSRSDAVLLLLLNELGVDIIVYNPPGYKCIENHVDPQWFDIHWLEDMVLEQEFKEPSKLRRFFSSIKL